MTCAIIEASPKAQLDIDCVPFLGDIGCDLFKNAT